MTDPFLPPTLPPSLKIELEGQDLQDQNWSKDWLCRTSLVSEKKQIYPRNVRPEADSASPSSRCLHPRPWSRSNPHWEAEQWAAGHHPEDPGEAGQRAEGPHGDDPGDGEAGQRAEGLLPHGEDPGDKTIKDLHLKIRFTNSPGPEVDAGQGTVDKLRPGSKTHRHVIA